MAVSNKNRRKILVGGKEYLWRVKKKKGPRLEIIDPFSRKKYMSGFLTGSSDTHLSEDVKNIIALGAYVHRDAVKGVFVSITPRVVRCIIERFPNFISTS